MDTLFKHLAQNIKVYCGIETIVCPYEKNVTITYLNPLPIKAIVTDLTQNKIQYTMAGIITSNAKEIIIEKKYLSLLKASQKIEINNEYYHGYRINGKLSYRIEQNYIRANVYIKQV